ncbi:hypothetical protein R1sor_020057 [Riccia sorocarpa]|uniref:Uncharacterized protein n=1 Tax=Riccia sorocarpa TaxID=122646 RepID=A0ABD3II30_9MARC
MKEVFEDTPSVKPLRTLIFCQNQEEDINGFYLVCDVISGGGTKTRKAVKDEPESLCLVLFTVVKDGSIKVLISSKRANASDGLIPM